MRPANQLARDRLDAARSRIVMHAGRCFLESERFDRHGARGRSPLVSLGTLDAAFVGSGGNWREAARRLAALGVIRESDLRRVDALWWFGRLIGNTDMHGGNLSFGIERGQLALAPVYDMLPMAWAPLRGGEVTWPTPEPAFPLPGEEAAWERAREVARRFVARVDGDGRVSAGMRAVVGRMGF